jgi:hypothetical protein
MITNRSAAACYDTSMSRVPLLASLLALATAAALCAQNGDTNPGHDPNVFLDNHRPLIQKKQKPATSRTLSGKVVDDSGQPLANAVVTLTDGKTGEKRTFFTKKDGRYNFEDLSFSIDYEVRARYKDLQSEPRKLSQYDHMANVVRILEVTDSDASAKK